MFTLAKQIYLIRGVTPPCAARTNQLHENEKTNDFFGRCCCCYCCCCRRALPLLNIAIPPNWHHQPITYAIFINAQIHAIYAPTHPIQFLPCIYILSSCHILLPILFRFWYMHFVNWMISLDIKKLQNKSTAILMF